jgi:putative membrane protein
MSSRQKSSTALRLRLALPAALALVPGTALAHDAPTRLTVWEAWSWDPALLGGLALLTVGYSFGATRLWQRSQRGRSARRRELYCFAGAVLTLVVALISPLDAMGHALFSAHMVQHLLLILVAAPLLVLARPMPALLWALRGGADAPRGLKAASRIPFSVLRSPFYAPLAWALHAAALWAWHTPLLYDAAVANPAVHAAEHVAFFGTALLFWWAVLGPRGAGRIDPGAGVLYVFTMALQGSVLAALLTFAPQSWYSAHGAGAVIWRLAHPEGAGAEGLFVCGPVEPASLDAALLEDQQLAGLLMWVPAGMVYTLAALWLLARWLGEAERRGRHVKEARLT